MKKRKNWISLISVFLISFLILLVVILIIVFLNKFVLQELIDSDSSPLAAPRSGARGGNATQCDDHIDNDGDGYCDYLRMRGSCRDGSILGDPDCSSRNDNSEQFICNAATEVCDNIDNDCDGLIDENEVCTTNYYCDTDGDNYIGNDIDGTCFTFGCIPQGCYSNIGNDCNDLDTTVNPGVIENCDANGIDNDCDGLIDECIDPCTNGVKDGNESDVDCGGSCQLCSTGKICRTSNDCITNVCSGGICIEDTTNLNANCRAILYDGTTTSGHINLVFVPSGFNGDMVRFSQEAQRVWEAFTRHTPFNSANPKLSAFFVPLESGSYCNFNCNGIDRLLCCDTSIARQISSTCTLNSRQTIVIHDSAQYGGAGYLSADVATTSTHPSAPEVAVHEVGHSLFSLGDEYNYAGSTAISSPNCDVNLCPKWDEMLGYQGVSCNGGRCGGDAYYASELTIMRALGYPFEEVNLRISCCTYYQETGVYPPYCEQFQQFSTLTNFCRNSGGSTGGAPPWGEVVKIPYRYEIRKNDAGNWILESASPRRQGIYPTSEVRGEGRGNLYVKITRANGIVKELRFDSFEDVEYPAERVLGGYTKLPRQALSIIADHKLGRVVSIEVNGRRVV